MEKQLQTIVFCLSNNKNRSNFEKYPFQHEDKAKQSKELVNKTLISRRIVLKIAIKTSRFFWVVTLFRELLLKHWIIVFYCPSTQRSFQASFDLNFLAISLKKEGNYENSSNE